MRILIISQYFWPENFQINFLAQELIKKNHQVTVLTGLPNYPQGKIYSGYRRFWPFKQLWQGIEIIRVPLLPRGNKSNLRLIFNYLSFAILATLFAPFLCRKPYDVIFVYEPSPITQVLPAVFLRKLRKIPVLLWVQDLWPQSLTAAKNIKSPFILTCVNKLVTFIYRRCDAILVQSRAFASHIESFNIPSSKIHYLPNTTDDFYKPLSLLPQADRFQLPQGFRVIFAGNIGFAQAIPTILEAAEQLRSHKHIQWIFAGDGSNREFLQQQIEARQLTQTVHWIGSFPAQEMPYLFSVCDALLLTLTRNEIFSVTIPSKLQSYLASGKPIIAAIDGEANRIIQETQSGLAVSAENSEQLAAAVLSICQLTKEEREHMGEQGFLYYQEHFEGQKLITKLESLFYSFIPGKIH